MYVCGACCFLFFLFFKQKTAYEMRISDWSSDVCSSDLPGDRRRIRWRAEVQARQAGRHVRALARREGKRMTGPATMLQLENITVDFDGFKAIDDLSLAIPSGSMTVVIGPNGAGKSTMCDTIIGRVRPTSGRVLFHGEAIQNELEHRIVGKGICRQFPTPGVLIGLSVIDNLRSGEP